MGWTAIEHVRFVKTSRPKRGQRAAPSVAAEYFQGSKSHAEEVPARVRAVYQSVSNQAYWKPTMLSLTTTTQKACAVNTGHMPFSCLDNRLKRRFFFFVVRNLTRASVPSPPHSSSCWWTPPSRLLESQPQRSLTTEKLLDSIPSRNYILRFQGDEKVPSWQDLYCLRAVWETSILSLINERTFAGRSGWAAG